MYFGYDYYDHKLARPGRGRGVGLGFAAVVTALGVLVWLQGDTSGVRGWIAKLPAGARDVVETSAYLAAQAAAAMRTGLTAPYGDHHTLLLFAVLLTAIPAAVIWRSAGRA
jgi:hypothetical protein